MIRSGKTRIGRVHHGRRDAGQAQAARQAFHLARQRMRIVRLLVAPAGRRDVDQDPSIFDSHRKRRDAILFEAGFALAGAAVEFPTMPRANDVIAIEAALAERTADMIADIGNRAELAILEGDRKWHRRCGDLGDRCSPQFVAPSDVDPIIFVCHDDLPVIAAEVSRCRQDQPCWGLTQDRDRPSTGRCEHGTRSRAPWLGTMRHASVALPWRGAAM